MPVRGAETAFRRPTFGIVAVLVVAGAATACKPMGKDMRAPQGPVTSIDDAESRLAANARRLEAAGISVPDAAPAPTEEAEVSEGDGGGGDDATALDDDDAPQGEGAGAEVAADGVDERDFVEEDAGPAPPAAAGSSDGFAAKRSDRSRCDRICELAASTCDLAQRVCDLADDHPDEARYQHACSDAELQCQAATDACSGCEA